VNKPMTIATVEEAHDFSKQGGVHIITPYETRWEWRNDHGDLHREDDMPALIILALYKCEEWYVNGVFHRDHGPARVDYNKSNAIIRTEWRFWGKLHRLDNPAIEWRTGEEVYSVDGVEFNDGDTAKYKEACRRFRIAHGLLEPGKLTKPARPAHTATTPNAAPTV